MGVKAKEKAMKVQETKEMLAAKKSRRRQAATRPGRYDNCPEKKATMMSRWEGKKLRKTERREARAGYAEAVRAHATAVEEYEEVTTSTGTGEGNLDRLVQVWDKKKAAEEALAKAKALLVERKAA